MTKNNSLVAVKLETLEQTIAELKALLATENCDALSEGCDPEDQPDDGAARLPNASFLRGTLGVSLARRHLNHRLALINTFGSEMVADPVWTMLLELLLAHYRRQDVYVSSLCIASGIPTTTALRWIGIMQERGLIERWPDSHDRRRIYVSLTKQGLSQVLAHLAPE